MSPALPPYRLATLVTLRERAKEAAEQALATELGALKKAQDQLEALRLELVRMEERRAELRRAYMDKAMAGEVGAQQAVQHNTYIEHFKDLEKRQAEAIVEQEDVVKEHEALVAAARTVLVNKTQELKALEKHREKWLEEVKKEIAAKEELVMDDIAQTIFLRGEAERKRDEDKEP